MCTVLLQAMKRVVFCLVQGVHLYPPEFRRGEVLPAVSDDAEARQVCQAGVHGGKPRQPHVSGSAHSWPALPHVSEGELIGLPVFQTVCTVRFQSWKNWHLDELP